MGDTLRYAEKMNLITMKPRNDLSSTSYALVHTGKEYLILQPSDSADPFTVELEAGAYAVEWFHVNRRETESTGKMTMKSNGNTSFTTPFAEAGPAVLYLKRISGS
jgi:hypothetical protein